MYPNYTTFAMAIDSGERNGTCGCRGTALFCLSVPICIRTSPSLRALGRQVANTDSHHPHAVPCIYVRMYVLFSLCDDQMSDQYLYSRMVLLMRRWLNLPTDIMAACSESIHVRYAGVFLMAAGIFPAIPCYLCLIPSNVSGLTKRATATALGIMVSFNLIFCLIPCHRQNHCLRFPLTIPLSAGQSIRLCGPFYLYSWPSSTLCQGAYDCSRFHLRLLDSCSCKCDLLFKGKRRTKGWSKGPSCSKVLWIGEWWKNSSSDWWSRSKVSIYALNRFSYPCFIWLYIPVEAVLTWVTALVRYT